MPVDLLLVERVDLRRLSGSAGRDNFLSDRFDRYLAATGEKNLSSFACKSARDSTADRTSGSVDHCNLVFQYHFGFLSWICTGPNRQSRR
jgi:hypothetical protein